MIPLVIVGAGGCGREVAASVIDINMQHPTFELLGFTDSNLSKGDVVNGLPVLGDLEYFQSCPDSVHAVIAVALPCHRKMIADKLLKIRPSLLFANIVANGASISPTTSTLGKGVIIYRDVILSVNMTVGDHVILNTRVNAGHDVEIGDFCTVGPYANLLGYVTVGEGSYVGACSVIFPKTKIESNSVVGLGSVVTRRVKSGHTVFGNPAKTV